MGFFQDLKEDLSLAMNELLPNEDMDEEIIKPDAKDTGLKAEVFADKGEKALVQENDTDADAFARELIDVALQPQESKETETLTVEQLVAAVEQSVSKDVSDMIEDEVSAVVLEDMEAEEPEEVAVEETQAVKEPEAIEEPQEEVAEGPEAIEEPEEEVVEETQAVKEPEEEVVEETQAVKEPEEEVAEESEAIKEPEEEVVEETQAVKEPEKDVDTEEDIENEKSQEKVAKEPEVKEMLIRNDNSFEKEVYEEIMKDDTGKNSENRNELESAVNEVVDERVESVMSQEVLDETAIVTKGMKVNGDISSQGSLDVLGSIKGNIEVLGKLNVSGQIEGNSNAAEVFADAAHITGEIHATGTVKVGINSVIIGNIFATSAVIAGAVKGDIDVHGPVVLDSSAIVMGNIKSKSVQMNNGAVIEGLCSQCYADVSPASFFKDIK